MDLLPDLSTGRLAVLVAPFAGGEALMTLAAHLVQRTRRKGVHSAALRVLDAGNRFEAYRLARAMHRLTRASLDDALRQVRMARAFTCYQVLTLLDETPNSLVPVLVIDLLDTFYDESVDQGERGRLLQACLFNLQRLSQSAPVLVSVRPLPPSQPQDPTGFFEQVLAAADRVWLPVPPPDSWQQPRLF